MYLGVNEQSIPFKFKIKTGPKNILTDSIVSRYSGGRESNQRLLVASSDLSACPSRGSSVSGEHCPDFGTIFKDIKPTENRFRNYTIIYYCFERIWRLRIEPKTLISARRPLSYSQLRSQCVWRAINSLKNYFKN